MPGPLMISQRCVWAVLAASARTTLDLLDQPESGINMVMLSWSGGVSDNAEQGIHANVGSETFRPAPRASPSR